MSTINLTGKTFQGKYPIVARSNDITYVGGRVTGPSDFDDQNTPWSSWHDTTGIIAKAARMSVVGTKFDMVGDGISNSYPQDADWNISSVEMTRVHDDAVENDSMNSGKIYDSLFDGVFDFLSCRGGSANSTVNGTGKTVSVDKCLVRLRPYYSSYKPYNYGYNQHGPFFKWATADGYYGIPPSLEVSNSIFCAGQNDAYRYGLDLPAPMLGSTVKADSVILVWTGTGSWPSKYLVNWQKYCSNLSVINGTLDCFNEIANDWRANH